MFVVYLGKGSPSFLIKRWLNPCKVARLEHSLCTGKGVFCFQYFKYTESAKIDSVPLPKQPMLPKIKFSSVLNDFPRFNLGTRHAQE